MKTHPSTTANGGKTIILDSAAEASALGLQKCDDYIDSVAEVDDTHVNVTFKSRDGRVETKKVLKSKRMAELKSDRKEHLQCVEAITKGDAKFNAEVTELAGTYLDMALELEPSLSTSLHGYFLSHEGVDADPGRIAAGEELCCLQRKRAGITPRDGGEAFRILLCTDHAWVGSWKETAAALSALVLVLQARGPVEVWVQQGWLGSAVGGGVTLFKLDFAGAFEPSQLAFWCGHPGRDMPYSWNIRIRLGRKQCEASHNPEIPCDLWIPRGLTTVQIDQPAKVAEWVVEKAMQIMQSDRVAA